MKKNETSKQNPLTGTDKLKVYNLVILDESGSMSTIRNAAIGGFNETVGGIRSAQEQYKETQEHFVSLLTFCSCKKHYIYENIPVANVPNLTTKEYQPCCGTPLFDAMGFSLNKLYSQIESDDNSSAVVTIITDGMENASKEFSGQAIKQLVDKLKAEGWNFAYIGTNQDVEEVAMSISIENHLSFTYDDSGMQDAWTNERKSKMRMYDRMNQDFACERQMTSAEVKAHRARRNREVRNYRDMGEFNNRMTPAHIQTLKPNEIFVFGSDPEGLHTGGAAHAAVTNFGAVMGQGVGLQGQSYAIPTMQGGVETIKPYVDEFITFAKEHPDMTFLVTPIGCGIAGFTAAEIAPLFISAIDVPNIYLPLDFWKEII